MTLGQDRTKEAHLGQGAQIHLDGPRNVHVDGEDVLGESVEDTAHGGGIEERHGREEHTYDHSFEQVPSSLPSHYGQIQVSGGHRD